MSQRIHLNPNRGQPAYAAPSYNAGYSPDPISTSRPTRSDNEVIAKIQEVSSQIEDAIEIYSQPIRPWVPAIARFLIVATFLEDAIRILAQWSDQKWYIEHQRGIPWGLSHMFLLINVIAMLAGSIGVIARRFPEYSVAALLFVVILQGIGYGLLFDVSFFLRNLSVIGGLLMVLSDSLATKKKIFAGLPSISETDRRKYVQLAGRVLLIFLFVGFIFQGNWSIGRVFVSIIGLGACIMVAVGFKAKWSASFLVLLLSVFNVLVNKWWSVHPAHPQRDFLKYDFFQTLSIVGGLLLLVNMGPGGISVDEKKKVY
ncbi:uncharacterized protein CcaverHIS019_0406650 [Cutaneotrichosporon cavernicola]|uniref:SURF4-domain-containing protein n=1 Tax=Cutaneotrichosporon cavernicola TaxID=279322 RepID=A0AA48QVZ0_9TREE|nr:uncharacterized protein CcaverHIS019_0406650 [Cutaneotrichosporon cavernicola]BEI91845.1 hypothetical protein CcaverHIS019_0406650 [Cutaneotrichosporon cavernicola]BEI99617.1 hypothetical protein CcaverHIS631_0406600 [Cutaneotrichosporon cavernicola]BEJ07393.1 hypothetical protein CcaverHIS641_0406620 [Cutaneotrichosporon cavernicola]